MEDLWIGVEMQQRGRSDNSGASSAKKCSQTEPPSPHAADVTAPGFHGRRRVTGGSVEMRGAVLL